MRNATQYSFEAMKDIFDGIIPVKKVGQTHIWFTPWGLPDPLVGNRRSNDGFVPASRADSCRI